MSEQATEWALPFTQAEVSAWKKSYGENNVHLVTTEEDDHYVIRGLYRKEFMDMQNGKFRNEEDLEDQYVLQALLYPQMTHMSLRDAPAALSNRLFERLVEVSNVDAHKAKEITEVTLDKLPEGVKKEDFNAWKARHKNTKFYVTEFEGNTYIYKGLRRNEYEKFRESQREEGKNQIASENEICSLGIVYPIPKDLDIAGNSMLYGTVSSLAIMIMKASGFGNSSTVTKL